MRFKLATIVGLVVVLAQGAAVCTGEGEARVDTARGDRMLAAYFRNETQELADACLADITTWDDWTSQQTMRRQQLREMLGLDPLPERTPLQAVVTGKVEREAFTVEKLHFQSRPGLYVTANLYLPKHLGRPAPAVLYLCGHSVAKKDGISYGNKTKYQHHGAWFARNGYVCLILDTLQLGEIEGVHHGTYREGRWWWNARGYTPAGVETWNAIRALDYLTSRPEVDAERLGVTGRSGGGAYSWYVAALDDRIRAAVPVAGITNLKNHVVDGCVEGHCDCMYVVNTHRWDYPQLAALVAPRPLLILNTDRDDIFPLDGVQDVYRKVRRLYELRGQPDQVELRVSPGPHEDSRVLQRQSFEFFNKHLRQSDAPVKIADEPRFELEQLKVFDELPADAVNARIDEAFTVAAEVKLPSSRSEWQAQREEWLRLLRAECFGGWPAEGSAPPLPRLVFDAHDGKLRLMAYDFASEAGIELRLFVLLPADAAPEELREIALSPVDADGWAEFLRAMQVGFAEELADEAALEADPAAYARWSQSFPMDRGRAILAPRGIGPTAWNPSPKAQIHIRRRFMLLGQTLDGMRVWDVCRAVRALREIESLVDVPLTIDGKGEMAGIALYAALFEPEVGEVELSGLRESHRDGPDFLNVLRFMDVPQAVAMVGEKSRVRIHQDGEAGWSYPIDVCRMLGLAGQVEVGQR